MYFFDGRIRYSEVDSQGKLTLNSLLNYFQDVTTFHSEDLGLGVSYLMQSNLVWVLSAWQIVVKRYPSLGERVKVGTAPYEFKGFMGLRNFVMMTEEGECLAVANSMWTLLNTETQRPVIPTADMVEGYVLEEKLEMEYAPRKITVPEGGWDCEPILIKKQHLDTNQHVNNGQYVDMAMEYLPADFTIRQMRAEYKMQTLLNEVLVPYVVQSETVWTVVFRDESEKVHAVVEFV